MTITNGPPAWHTDDRLVLSLTCDGEARGEGLRGKAAVCWVVVNRAHSRKQTIAEVCLAPKQFSCWNYNDPNAQRLDALAHLPEGQWPLAFRECVQVANDVIDGKTLDPTGGADHYLTLTLYHSKGCPRWAKQMTPTATIGNHIFLKETR